MMRRRGSPISSALAPALALALACASEVRADAPVMAPEKASASTGTSAGPGAMVVEADHAPPGFGQTLPPLLQWARERNPDFAALRFDAEAAQARVLAAPALADPVLLTELRDVTRDASGGGLTLDPSRVGSTRWQLSQALPGWGKRGRREGAAGAAASEAGYRAEAAWNEVVAQVRTYWTQSWRFAQAYSVTRQLKDLMRSVEETARRRYAAGLAPQQDALRAQLELSLLDAELAQMEADLHGQQARLNILLGRDADARLEVPEALPELPLVDHARHQQLIARLKEKNPTRLAELARTDAVERNRDVVRDARSPDYRLGLGAIQMGKRVAEWELMLEVTIPLQQGVRRAQESEAGAMASAAQARRQVVENGLLAELAHAVADYEAARRMETLATQSLAPQSEVAFQSALAAYETGRLDFAAVLDAQRQMRQAKLARIKAHADAQLRLTEIEKAVGEAL